LSRIWTWRLGGQLTSVLVELKVNNHSLSFVGSFYSVGLFDVWTGAYTYREVSLLACIAINDYHGVTSYTWVDKDTPMSNKTPLLYCVGGGPYVCSAHTDGFSIECRFVIRSKH